MSTVGGSEREDIGCGPQLFSLAYRAASPIAADINHARDGKCAEDVQDVRWMLHGQLDDCSDMGCAEDNMRLSVGEQQRNSQSNYWKDKAKKK